MDFKKLAPLLIAIALFLIMQSCVKDSFDTENTVNTDAQEMLELEIPEGFEFETSREVEGRNYDSDGNYTTDSGLPWAINIIHNFTVPTEGVAVNKAYNHFNEWATSGEVQKATGIRIIPGIATLSDYKTNKRSRSGISARGDLMVLKGFLPAEPQGQVAARYSLRAAG